MVRGTTAVAVLLPVLVDCDDIVWIACEGTGGVVLVVTVFVDVDSNLSCSYDR